MRRHTCELMPSRPGSAVDGLIFDVARDNRSGLDAVTFTPFSRRFTLMSDRRAGDYRLLSPADYLAWSVYCLARRRARFDRRVAPPARAIKF